MPMITSTEPGIRIPGPAGHGLLADRPWRLLRRARHAQRRQAAPHPARPARRDAARRVDGGRARPHYGGRPARPGERLEAQAGAPDFRGCRYLAVQIELKDQSHPASRVARQVKENLTAFFRAEAEQGGAGDPDLLARQLSLVFDGASARAGIGADTLIGLIAPTVAALLDTAGVR